MCEPKYKITIRWGAVDDDMLLEVADRTKTYSFNTLGELLDGCNAWDKHLTTEKEGEVL